MTNIARIVEVSPRDGLQNEQVMVPTAIKLELISRLVSAGASIIEATAFVSPKWVPQMADQSEIMEALGEYHDVSFPVLVPNMKGFAAAAAAGAREIAIFSSASEGFSSKNINCSIAESLERFVPVVEAAAASGVRVRGYVSCVIACPYDGNIAPQEVARVAHALFELGCYEISLGDTIGVGTPGTVVPMLEAVSRVVPIDCLAGHYHDTYGMGVANVHASWQFGLRTFDSSVSGLGGCPYAVGASGNVATEDIVYLLHGLGAETGIDLEKLVDCSTWIASTLGREIRSSAARAIVAKRVGGR